MNIKNHPKYQEAHCMECKRLIGYVYQTYPARNTYKCINCYVISIKQIAQM